ncbi:MAG TPA: hypothetical protein VGM04_06455 [Sphingomicrobium sp.]|jgi:hypothetical protein
MNAIQTEPYDLSYSDRPPILIAASSDAAMARAVRSIEAAGCRIGDRMSLDTARERIEQQVAASAVWLELDRDCGAQMDDLLDFVDGSAADGCFAAVVSSSADLIDLVTARIGDGAAELIVDADEPQRAAALALATATAGIKHRLSDVASDQNAERLRQLSDEVGRIAATLARLPRGRRFLRGSSSPSLRAKCPSSRWRQFARLSGRGG